MRFESDIEGGIIWQMFPDPIIPKYEITKSILLGSNKDTTELDLVFLINEFASDDEL